MAVTSQGAEPGLKPTGNRGSSSRDDRPGAERLTTPEASFSAWSGLTLGVLWAASGVFLAQSVRIRNRAKEIKDATLGRKAQRMSLDEFREAVSGELDEVDASPEINSDENI